MNLLCRILGHARVQNRDPSRIEPNGVWTFPCPRCGTYYRPPFNLLPGLRIQD